VPGISCPYRHAGKVGPYTVYDASSSAWQCDDEKCGEVELTLEELAGYQRRAALTVLRRATNVDSAVMRYGPARVRMSR
jgi:hypothetical protein